MSKEWVFALRSGDLATLSKSLEFALDQTHEDEDICAALDHIDQLIDLAGKQRMLTDPSQEHLLLKGLMKAREHYQTFPDDPDLTPKEVADLRELYKADIEVVESTLKDYETQRDYAKEEGLDA